MPARARATFIIIYSVRLVNSIVKIRWGSGRNSIGRIVLRAARWFVFIFPWCDFFLLGKKWICNENKESDRRRTIRFQIVIFFIHFQWDSVIGRRKCAKKVSTRETREAKIWDWKWWNFAYLLCINSVMQRSVTHTWERTYVYLACSVKNSRLIIHYFSPFHSASYSTIFSWSRKKSNLNYY